MKACLFGTLALILTGCAAPLPEVDPDYRAVIEQWRAGRVERLTAEQGWLTVVGLHWLRDGVNVHAGKVTQQEVAHDLGYDFHDPESLLS